MSATFKVRGYIDLRIWVDSEFSASNGCHADDVAKIVADQYIYQIGKCTVDNHLLEIEKISG